MSHILLHILQTRWPLSLLRAFLERINARCGVRLLISHHPLLYLATFIVTSRIRRLSTHWGLNISDPAYLLYSG